jgi:hypothetical protein
VHSIFSGIVELNLVDVVVLRWERLLIDQSFALNRPVRTVPAIQATLHSRKTGRAKIADVILAAEEAVGRCLPDEARAALRTSAAQETKPVP